MRINSAPLALAAVFAAVFAIGLWQHPVAAFVPPQRDSEPIIVTENDCDFDLDNNGDGQPDQPFDPAGGGYLPQHTTVIAHCWFQVTTIADAVIQLESGLESWYAVAEITKATEQYSEDVELNGGESDTVIKAGGHHVNLNMFGQTPRGSDTREVGKGYRHELQVPNLFRLIDIAITTDARDKEVVVSETVSSASTAYIRAHDAIADAESDPENALPPSVLELGRELLEEGYPRTAERVVNLEFQMTGNGEKGGLLPIWGYGVIIAGAVLLIAIGVVIWLWKRQPTPPDNDD